MMKDFINCGTMDFQSWSSTGAVGWISGEVSEAIKVSCLSKESLESWEWLEGPSKGSVEVSVPEVVSVSKFCEGPSSLDDSGFHELIVDGEVPLSDDLISGNEGLSSGERVKDKGRPVMEVVGNSQEVGSVEGVSRNGILDHGMEPWEFSEVEAVSAEQNSELIDIADSEPDENDYPKILDGSGDSEQRGQASTPQYKRGCDGDEEGNKKRRKEELGVEVEEGGFKLTLCSGSPSIIFTTKVPEKEGRSRNDSKEEESRMEEDKLTESEICRKCVVCLKRNKFVRGIFDETIIGKNGIGKKEHLCGLLSRILDQLNISVEGSSREVGICFTCLDSLERWDIFKSAVEVLHSVPQGSVQGSSLMLEPFERRVYRNFNKIERVKGVYLASPHSHLCRRHLTDRDWDFFCENVGSLPRSESALMLEEYLTSSEKLTHFHCNVCESLINGGKEGYVNHMKDVHLMMDPSQIQFPCDICGGSFVEVEPKNRILCEDPKDYYGHWISHFFQYLCETCGGRFPTEKTLRSHKNMIHRSANSTETDEGRKEAWNCEECGILLRSKGGLKMHQRWKHQSPPGVLCESLVEAKFQKAVRVSSKKKLDEKKVMETGTMEEILDEFLGQALRTPVEPETKKTPFINFHFNEETFKLEKIPKAKKSSESVEASWPHSCSSCGKKFRFKGDRIRHEISHRRKQPEDSKPRKKEVAKTFFHLDSGVRGSEKLKKAGAPDALMSREKLKPSQAKDSLDSRWRSPHSNGRKFFLSDRRRHGIIYQMMRRQ